jgi:hypothetical protein
MTCECLTSILASEAKEYVMCFFRFGRREGGGFAISYCYNEILLEELNQVFAAFIEE